MWKQFRGKPFLFSTAMYRAKTIKKCFSELVEKYILVASQNPDLHPIKHLWDELNADCESEFITQHQCTTPLMLFSLQRKKKITAATVLSYFCFIAYSNWGHSDTLNGKIWSCSSHFHSRSLLCSWKNKYNSSSTFLVSVVRLSNSLHPILPCTLLPFLSVIFGCFHTQRSRPCVCYIVDIWSGWFLLSKCKCASKPFTMTTPSDTAPCFNIWLE